MELQFAPFGLLLVAFLAVLLLLAWPLARWMAMVFEGRLPRWLAPVVALERAVYRLAGVDASAGMGWRPYALALIVFNVVGTLFVYGLQRLQQWLPLNPQGMAAASPDSSFNTAISFATNTNWQGYAGEATMSYLTQMLALTVQNFLSAATGIVVVVALIRVSRRDRARASETSGSTSCALRFTCCCRCRWCSACSSPVRGSSRTSRPPSKPPRLRPHATSNPGSKLTARPWSMATEALCSRRPPPTGRRSPWDRWLRRKRSR